MKGFGLASLAGARRGYMPPHLKTNKNKTYLWQNSVLRIPRQGFVIPMQNHYFLL